jgi:hypothetical protein
MRKSTWIWIGVIVLVLLSMRERFTQWPGAGFPSMPPFYAKEPFVNKTCPDNTRSDGPCLMEF